MRYIVKIFLWALFGLTCLSLSAVEANVIHIKGSDTMIIVAQAWSEAYERVNPKVIVSVGGGGSGTGLDALLRGTVEVANASRRMHTHELKRARRLGMRPVQYVVGYDALAVFVNPNNPIESLSLSQLEQIFAEGGTIRTWDDLQVHVPNCPKQKIVRAGRQNNSGTYVYFRNAVLGRGQDYDFGIMDMLSSKDVVHLVEKTPCAIGYSGLAYATPKVRMVCLAKTRGQACVEPSVTSAVDGSYPIARPLFMYTREEPKGALKEYIEWILSDQGQCIIAEKGYAPVRDVKCE